MRAGRSALLVTVAVLTGAASLPLYFGASQSVPRAPDPDGRPAAGDIQVFAEDGVQLGLSYGGEGQSSSSVTDGSQQHAGGEEIGGLGIYAAWPRAWARPPLIIVAVVGRPLSRPSFPDRMGVNTLFSDCSGGSCTAFDGQLIELSARSEHEPDPPFVAAYFQLFLAPKDPPWFLDTDLEQRADQPLRALLEATDDQVVGGMELPLAPTTLEETAGAVTRVTFPAFDVPGPIQEPFPICDVVACTEQARRLQHVIHEGKFVDADVAPLLDLKRFSTEPYRDGFEFAYLELQLDGDWSATTDSAIPRLDGRTPAAWLLGPRDLRPGLSVLVESRSAAATERRFIYWAGVLAGLGAGFLTAAVELLLERQPTTRSSRRADRSTKPLAAPRAFSWVALGALILLAGRRGSRRD